MDLKDYIKLDKESLDTPLNDLEKELISEYKEQMSILEENVNQIYDKYEDENGDIQYQLLVGSALWLAYSNNVDNVTKTLQRTKDTKLSKFFSDIYDDNFIGMREIVNKDIQQNILDFELDRTAKNGVVDYRLGGASTSERLLRDRNDSSFLLKQRVDNSLMDNNTNKQTREEIKKVLDSDLNTAMTIAETKGHYISEGSKKILAAGLFEARNIRLIKVWQTMEDEKVRAKHNNANQQERELDEEFYVGGEYLDRPGDPKGSPGNIIHCRCIIEYRLK